MMTIRRAVPGDLRTVSAILRSVAGWLHRQGYDQWPDDSPSFTPSRIGGQIGRSEFWIVSDGPDPVAVIALSRDGDTDFWSPADLVQPAMYLSKAAVLRKAAGRGLGALLLRWAVDRAAREGVAQMRLDVWKTNWELQEYYRLQGWTYLRTVQAEGRNSGALFCRPALPDIEAHDAFMLVGAPTVEEGPVTSGARVITPTEDGPLSATCLRATEDRAYDEVTAGWEFGTVAPQLYEVERDGKTWFTHEAWADPQGAVVA